MKTLSSSLSQLIIFLLILHIVNLQITPFGQDWAPYYNMTVKGGGISQACAACKYQRRKCSSKCPLAPYFPPDQPNIFQNVHRLFGVSNILKILRNLNSVQKGEAMRSIIYESNIRTSFPVYGCLGIIRHLHHQIYKGEEELQATVDISKHIPPMIPVLHNNNNALPLYRQHHHPYDVMDTAEMSLTRQTSFSSLTNMKDVYEINGYIDSKYYNIDQSFMDSKAAYSRCSSESSLNTT